MGNHVKKQYKQSFGRNDEGEHMKNRLAIVPRLKMCTV